MITPPHRVAMDATAAGASIPEATHHRVSVNGTDLHYVEAGSRGSPVLLVHGFPESWWTFRGVIPRLAESHRVFAVDLRGFGDSLKTIGDDPAISLVMKGPRFESGRRLSLKRRFRVPRICGKSHRRL